MSEPNVRLQLLALAVQTGLSATDEIIGTAKVFEAYVDGGSVATPAKPKATVKDKPPAAPAATAEAGKAIEPADDIPAAILAAAVPTATVKDVTEAVIALVNAGNAAAGDEKTGRQYAAAVLQPFGANKVSNLKTEDYGKVLEALKAKLVSVQAEADIAG